MRRRTILAALGTVATMSLAGCVAGDDNSSSEGETVVGQFETDPQKPTCQEESETIEVDIGDESETYETAATVPYPSPPDSFDNGTLTDYTEKFDRAYITQSELCTPRSGYILQITHTVSDMQAYTGDDGITRIWLLRTAGPSAGTNEQKNGVWEAGLAVSGILYAVDPTGVASVEFDPDIDPNSIPDDAPDPLTSGTLLANFD